MERIIDGRLFEGKRVPDAFEIRVWEQHGHREVSASPVIEWVEVGDAPNPRPRGLPPGSYLMDADELAKALKREKDDAEQRRVDNLKRNAQRAKTACRRIIKAEGFNEMGTLTYRDNQQDRALCKEHFKEFVRRMKRAFGGVFRYCASFEKQDRGAMHVHLAMHKFPQHANVKYKGVKVPAWRVGTVIWREIVGDDNGLFFVGGKPSKFGGPRRHRTSLAKMAAYVSKYIMKDYDTVEASSNRYSRSNGLPVVKPTVMRFSGTTLGEIIGMVFQLGEGDVMVDHRCNEERGSYWLCTERERPRPVPQIEVISLAARRASQVEALMSGMGRASRMA